MFAEDKQRVDEEEPTTKEDLVSLAMILLILALLIGGVGLFVEALQWVLIIALVLFVWGAITGWRSRSSV